MVAFSQVKPNTIKLRALPVFPSRVIPGPGLAIERSNGVYDFSIDFSDLERDDPITPTELTNLYVAAWDGTAETFRLYLASTLKGEQGDQGIPGSATDSDHATRAIAEAAHIAAPINYLRTAGYTTYGDGGDALYKRVLVSTPGGFQSADGAWWQIVLTGKVANVLAFGAVPNDATKAAINQTAFTNAFAACPNVSVPAGLTLYTQRLAPPVTAKLLQLDGDLIAAGTYTASTGVVDAQNITSGSFALKGSGSITVDIAAYPTITGVKTFGTNNSTIDGISIIGGEYAIRFGSQSGTKIQNTRIEGYRVRGIELALTSNTTSIINNRITGGVAGSDHAISIGAPNDKLTISENQVSECLGWSYSIQQTTNFIVSGNLSMNSRLEGLVVGQTSGRGIVCNNKLTFNNTHYELGMSVEHCTDIVVSGNEIYQPHSTAIYFGIGVASGSVTGNNCTAPALRTVTYAENNGSGKIRLTLDTTAGMASGNYDTVFGVVGTVEANDTWIIDKIGTNQIDLRQKVVGGAPSVFTNAYVSGGKIGDPNWVGVAMYQGAGGLSITGNKFRDFNNVMQFLVKEFDAPTDPNFVSNNHGDAPQNATVSVLNANSYVSDDMGMTVAKLPTSIKGGSRIYVTDGTPGSNPLTAGGTGTWAVRLNGAWRASP